MRKVLFEEKVRISVRKYLFDYKNYFHSLYCDTGIFSESLIIEQYEKEGNARHREIFDIMQSRLSPDIVHGRTPMNTLHLPWRSRTLLITWKDEGDRRIITDLIIQ